MANNAMLGKSLVTGADGFIGSHLVEALVHAGHPVRAFVLYNSLNSWGWLDHVPVEIKSEIEVMPGDVRDAARVRQAMHGCETVFHLAALISIPYSYHAAESYVDTNVRGTLNVVQAACDLGVSRVICTSTSEVYGTARFVPITEEHPLQAQSPYAASKIGADMIALSFHAAFGTPVIVVRPFNTYGPRQSARAVIPTIISQIATGARRVQLGALEPTRDFSYVQDTVSGFMQAAACNELLGEVVNVGSGFEISIGETAKVIAETMGAEVEIVCDQARIRPKKSEVERLWAATDKARKTMGWNPEFGGLDGFRRGIGKTVEWFRQPANLACYKTAQYNI